MANELSHSRSVFAIAIPLVSLADPVCLASASGGFCILVGLGFERFVAHVAAQWEFGGPALPELMHMRTSVWLLTFEQ